MPPSTVVIVSNARLGEAPSHIHAAKGPSVTIDDLISQLSTYPGDLDVRMLVATREGIFNDAICSSSDRLQLCETGDAIWLIGSETADAVTPRWVTVKCHCGIEHHIDTTGPICELPARRNQQ